MQNKGTEKSFGQCSLEEAEEISGEKWKKWGEHTPNSITLQVSCKREGGRVGRCTLILACFFYWEERRENVGSKNASWLLLNRITEILMSTEMVTFAFGCCEEEAE